MFLAVVLVVTAAIAGAVVVDRRRYHGDPTDPTTSAADTEQVGTQQAMSHAVRQHTHF